MVSTQLSNLSFVFFFELQGALFMIDEIINYYKIINFITY
jgi:hypothetical protein